MESDTQFVHFLTLFAGAANSPALHPLAAAKIAIWLRKQIYTYDGPGPGWPLLPGPVPDETAMEFVDYALHAFADQYRPSWFKAEWLDKVLAIKVTV